MKLWLRTIVRALRELIAHCLQPDAGGFTPSDFPLATLTQGQIDALVRQQTQIEAIYPLSPLQQGLLFHSLYAPQGGDHIVQVGYTLRGHVDVTALLRAWQQVIEQYSILRTSFVWEQLDTPLQVVHEHATMPFTTHDWRSLSPLLHDERLLAFLHKDRREGFVLSHAPLMRIHLIQMADDSFELIWTHHHLLLDGWSFPLLLQEVFACYAAFCEGHMHQVEGVRPYQDYIAWVLQQDVQLAESFWRRCLHGLTQPTMLQVPTPIHPEPGYGELILHTSAELSTTLARFARQQHLTLNTLFQAAWALLLHHYSGQLDVLFGTIVSGRPAALQGVERMIGLFINTVPVRVHVDPALAVLPWLHHIQETHSELRQFEYSPLVQVHNWSQLPRGEALFESLLIFENYPLTPQESLQDAPTRLTIQAAHTQEQTTYPLSLYVVPGDPIAFKVLFDRRRFSQTTISRLLEHLQQLLATLVAHPAQSLATIQTLSHEEQHTLLHTFNATHLPVPQECCIHHLFEQQAVLTPQAIALHSDHDVLSYAQLNERANQLAHYLHAHGVGPNVLVGVCISRSPDMLVALLAILKAGGAYVPLDPAYPAERLAFLLTDAHVALLLTQEHLLTLLPAVQVPRLCLDRDWSVLADLPRDHAPHSTVSSHDLAYVIYTSGSTGTPKGVCIHHRNTVTLLYWAREQFDAQCLQGVLASTSICFDLSVFELFVPLSWGGTVILAENALALPTLPAAEHVRLINTVPSAMAELVRSGSVPASVRVVNLAGEALQRSLVHDLFALPHIQRVCNLYGPTEDTTYSTWADLAAQDDGAVPIGRPIANTQVYLLDAHLQLVPIGVTGELYLGGAGIAQGYLHRPELTAERFIAHPFSDEPGARLYRTGDLARYRDDGTLDYLGRRDQQVKIRGYRIEVGEIESVLLQHPTVQDAVVVAHEENPTQYRLIAYIVSATETLFSDAQLRAYVQERLPSYMLPSLFVPLDVLPLTPNGKVDRRALPNPEIDRTLQIFIAPHTAIEQKLATIWSKVLGVTPISVHDNFFALGGDSILSIQIVSRAHQAGLTITPKQLFQAPTIAELATMITTGETAPEIVAQQGLVVGAVPLTPIQHWFFAQHQPARQHWNQAVLLCVTQPLNASVLRQTVAHLLIQHDALRFRFSNAQQGWQQDSHVPDEQVPLHLFDLSTLTAMQQTQALEQLANDVQASLDIEHGPLVRVASFHLGSQAQDRLLIVVHHLAIDAVSWRILLEDLQQVYEQLSLEQRAQLPAKTTSFQQWSQLLLDHAQSATVLQQLPYWLTQTLARHHALPVDHYSGANTAASARHVVISLSLQETASLLHEVPAAYHTQINDVLLTALAMALSQWTGQHAHVIDLEGHGREDLFAQVDLSRTIGWFTTLFPVLLDLSDVGTTSPADALKTIKERLRHIPQRGIGYGLLRYLSSPADGTEEQEALIQLRTRPAADLSFNYLGQFDQIQQNTTLLRAAPESSGSVVSPHSIRTHLIDINGSISGGQLNLIWTYSMHRHRAETIEALAQNYLRALRELIAHCLQPDAGGFTPSDFPLAVLTQDQIDTLLSQHKQVEAIYPLSPLQQGFLFHSLYAPEEGNYIVQVRWTLQGDLHIPAFKAAWQSLLDHHAILRTCFLWDTLAEPLQVVREHIQLPFLYEQWLHSSPDEQQAQLALCLQHDRIQGFDLAQAPLLRLRLIQMAQDTYTFIWSYHHILLDGWSIPLLLKELFTSYLARCEGQSIPRTHTRPYHDYIAWLVRQNAPLAEAFWKRALAGFTAPTPLGIDHMPPTMVEQHAGVERAHFPHELPAQLQQMTREHKLTLHTVLQGAWALLLSRYSQQHDVVFGSTSSGRSAGIEGIEEMVGLFINTLPVRVQVAPEALLIPWLQALQDQQSEMHQYEYSSLTQVQGYSEVPRGIPLFESLLVLENYPVDNQTALPAQQDKGQFNILPAEILEQSHYPLNIVVLPGTPFTIMVRYNQDRFETTHIVRLLHHLTTILTNMVTRPTQSLAQIAYLSPDELHHLLVEWNATHKEYPHERCFHHLFTAQAQRTPDASALVAGHQHMTYRELDERSNQLAHSLQQRGIGPEMLVGVCVERSIAMVVGQLAALKAGAAYLPLDPTYPQERLAYLLADARVCVLLTQEKLVPNVTGSSPTQLFCLDRDWDQVEMLPTTLPMSRVQPDNLAYVIYTSGSTGQPKGVQISHRNLLNLITWHQQTYQLHGQDRTTQIASMAFDACVWEIWPTLAAGASLFFPDEETRHSPLHLRDWLLAERITHCFIPTPLTESVLSLPWPAQAPLRFLLTGGDVLHHAPEHLLPFHLINHYGPTESTVVATAGEVQSQPLQRRAPSIGRPIANTQVYILDASLQLVSPGVVGEICLGGASLSRGYLSRPDETAEKFIAHPFSDEPGARLYRTGDLARYRADGQIEFVGRRDEQVKIRGYRIEVGEIESVLGHLPGVQDAVVVAREDIPGTKRLVAYIVPGSQAGIEEQGLRQALHERLPEYMVPSALIFLAALPLTPNGKVDRTALVRMHLPQTNAQHEVVLARTQTEQRLADIWSQVLGVEQIGIHDNFFALGGDFDPQHSDRLTGPSGWPDHHSQTALPGSYYCRASDNDYNWRDCAGDRGATGSGRWGCAADSHPTLVLCPASTRKTALESSDDAQCTS